MFPFPPGVALRSSDVPWARPVVLPAGYSTVGEDESYTLEVTLEDAFLCEQFARQAANDARFQPLAGGDKLIEELKPLSKDLSAPDAAGKNKQKKEMAVLARPQPEVIAGFRPVKALLDTQ